MREERISPVVPSWDAASSAEAMRRLSRTQVGVRPCFPPTLFDQELAACYRTLLAPGMTESWSHRDARVFSSNEMERAA